MNGEDSTSPFKKNKPIDELEAALRGLDAVVNAASGLAKYCAGTPHDTTKSLAGSSGIEPAPEAPTLPDLKSRMTAAVRWLDALRSELDGHIQHISSAL